MAYIPDLIPPDERTRCTKGHMVCGWGSAIASSFEILAHLRATPVASLKEA